MTLCVHIISKDIRYVRTKSNYFKLYHCLWMQVTVLASKWIRSKYGSLFQVLMVYHLITIIIIKMTTSFLEMVVGTKKDNGFNNNSTAAGLFLLLAIHRHNRTGAHSFQADLIGSEVYGCKCKQTLHTPPLVHTSHQS